MLPVMCRSEDSTDAGGLGLGGVLAFEMPGTGQGDYYHPVGARVAEYCKKEGLLIRPLGNTIYLVPPLTISEEELDYAFSVLRGALDQVPG